MDDGENHFSGMFPTEEDSCKLFDSYIDKCNFFYTIPEVEGFYVQPRPMTEEKDPRIDRLMIPTQLAVDSGWGSGAIGIEIKRSGGTIGPGITQAIDYTRCVFRIDGGVLVMPVTVFIFPLENPYKAAESVMINNRIGHVWENTYKNELLFRIGSINILIIDLLGNVSLIKNPNTGNKRGSRSSKRDRHD